MQIVIRKAVKKDITDIVRLLAEDPMANGREDYSDPLPDYYYKAFEAIDGDENQLLLVAEASKKVIGTLQLTFIPNISFKGATRALIEAVMVDDKYQRQGIGQKLMQSAIVKAKEKNCRFVQLTSNKKREDAHRFYMKCGFIPTHEGMKLEI